MYNTFHQDVIPCRWSQNTGSGTGSYVMLSGAQAMSLMSWNAGQPCQLPAVQDGGLTAHQRAHTCCQCPRCAVGVPDVLSVSQMCHASPAVYKAAAAQPRPQQRSYTQRCGAMLIPVVGLWPQAVTSRGSRCTSGGSQFPPSPCRLPARPARSRRPWPRCWNGRAARPRSALLARGARASGRARVSTRETCDIPPKHGAAAGTALSRYQQLEGRCHTWWHCLEKWACLDLEVIFTWPHDWGQGTREKYHVHGKRKWRFTGTNSAGLLCQAVRQLGNRQGPFQNILLHITACRESVNWKAPLTSVMNCTLSQIQNEEIISCFPAGTEKPRNICDLWVEYPL